MSDSEKETLLNSLSNVSYGKLPSKGRMPIIDKEVTVIRGNTVNTLWVTKKGRIFGLAIKTKYAKYEKLKAILTSEY